MQHARRRLIATFGGLAVSAVAVTAALGSPPSGFTAVNLVGEAELQAPVHINSDRVKFQTKGPADVRVQDVRIVPGGRSGWHHHPGMVIVAVEQGSVTVVDSSCHGTSYGTGSVFTESGDEPMEVRNTGTEPAHVFATHVAPDTDPGVFRIEDAPVSCP
jgi:quercetin dioxygenase-like cupin family protein